MSAKNIAVNGHPVLNQLSLVIFDMIESIPPIQPRSFLCLSRTIVSFDALLVINSGTFYLKPPCHTKLLSSSTGCATGVHWDMTDMTFFGVVDPTPRRDKKNTISTLVRSGRPTPIMSI